MMRHCRALVLLVAATGACVANLSVVAQPANPQPANQQPANQPPQADVPVKSVVLFSSGVGYFEHYGTIQGDGSTELRFKTSQINDILKSLILQDLDGGFVSTIQYPSQDPIAKTLRSFQVDITSNPSLSQLVNQLRGAKITVTAGSDKVTGTVVGVENRKMAATKDSPVVDVPFVNILSGATIRSVNLNEVRDLQLDDTQLQDELTRALAALSQARDQDKKPVTFNFRGQGERRVRLGYVVETPIWKTSYRLILPAGGAQDKPRLQGWAIVENQTENDWKDVQLSLVSGRPISFIMDLYQPLYIPRPVVVQELFASLRPQTYDAGMEARRDAEVAKTMQPPAAPAPAMRAQQDMARSRGGGALSASPAEGKEAFDQPLDASSSVQSVASASKIGELFQYTVGSVSLPRQKSAMLPIITDDVEVERLSIYNPSVLPRNPLTGARVKNTTDKHLLQGPITVLDGGSYAGDAQIDNVPPGQERLISYGIDLQVLVDAKSSRNEVRLVSGKIVKGVLILQRKYLHQHDYTVENKSDKDKTVVVEHAFRPGWKLDESQAKPIERTDSLYRFKFVVPPGKPQKLPIQEELVSDERMEILPLDLNTMLVYSRTGEIPQKVRDALIRAAQLKQALLETERQMNEKAQMVATITQEQVRIRENMRTVNDRNSEVYNRWLKKLNEQETQIEQLQSEREQLSRRAQQQRKELEEYVSGLNIE
jgi:hypothetical protein